MGNSNSVDTTVNTAVQQARDKVVDPAADRASGTQEKVEEWWAIGKDAITFFIEEIMFSTWWSALVTYIGLFVILVIFLKGLLHRCRKCRRCRSGKRYRSR